MTAERVAEIEKRLNACFCPDTLRVKDQSHLHAGHAGARDGGGHFDVTVVADCFEAMPRLQRHREVHDCLADLLESDIHALRIKAFSPKEFAKNRPE